MMKWRKVLLLITAIVLSFGIVGTEIVSAATKKVPATIKVPAKYNGAIVKKTFSNNSQWAQASWSQDEHTYYLKPKKARAYASKIEKGKGAQITEYILGTIVGARFTAPVALIGGMALLDSLRRGEIATSIRKQSEKGPVKFTLIKSRYGWGYSKVTRWDGKTINTSQSKFYKLNGYSFVK